MTDVKGKWAIARDDSSGRSVYYDETRDCFTGHPHRASTWHYKIEAETFAAFMRLTDVTVREI